jgi:hypothetical protein
MSVSDLLDEDPAPNTSDKKGETALSQFEDLTIAINVISLRNFPLGLRIQIFVFKTCHYLVLAISLLAMLSIRAREWIEWRSANLDEVGHNFDLYLMINGIIYVTYNLEIASFFFMVGFLKRLNELPRVFFAVKIFLEIALANLSILKIIGVYFKNKLYPTDGILFTRALILQQLFMLAIHCVLIVLIVLVVQIRLKFKRSRVLREIYQVFYLDKNLFLEHLVKETPTTDTLSDIYS